MDSVKNLLNEYKKWRPVIYFHYRMKSEQDKKEAPKSKKN